MPHSVPTTDGSTRPPSSRRGIQAGVGVAALGAALIVAVVLLSTSRTSPARRSGSQVLAGAASAPTSLAPTTLGTTTSAPGTTGGAAADVGPASDPATEAKVTAITSAFIIAWLQPGTPDQRAAALKSLTTTQLLPRVANVPADALPRGTLSAIKVMAFDETTAIVAATLSDGVTAICELVPTAGGHWQVSALDRRAGPVTASVTSTPSS